MLTLRQSAETLAPNSCESAVLLITFTSSRRCRERFLQAEFIEQIKKSSSKWIKALDLRYRGFFWQRGYSAFSVSPSQLDAVLQYVEEQPAHHRTRTFQEEYRELLRKHGVEFDERYFWD
jgi:REP-associated tyrosine transposase